MALTRKKQWFLLMGLLLFSYGHILVQWIAVLFTDGNYSHGLLIPFISLYIIKEQSNTLSKARSNPYNGGVLILLTGLALFVLGSVAGELFTKRLSLIIVLYGLVLFLEGKEIAALLRFPIALLLFALPLPYLLYNAVAFPLKTIATKMAVSLLSLYGMPVFREGNIVHLPHTVLEVVDACSGIRSLMTLITLAFLLACLMHKSFLLRFMLMLMAIPIAVLANALRVAMNGILTSYSPAWGEGFLHEFSGWLVFIVSFAVLGAISYFFTVITSSARL